MTHDTTEMMMLRDWQNISRNDVWVWAPVSWEWWEVVRLVLAIIGIIGNLLVMLVIFWPKRRRCATDTLIGALAVADFLTSVFMIPLPTVANYPDTMAAVIYCKFFHTSSFMWISICVSIFTLTTISIERLMAVRFPFWFQRLFSPKRISIAVIVIWMVTFAINTFNIYAFSITNGKCVISLTVDLQRFFGVFIFLLQYILPVITMVTAHSWTIYTLRQRRATALRKAQNHVLQMLLIVVITFIFCWTPDQFGFLVFNLGIVDSSYLFSPVHLCFVILAFANSCVNPFIYAAKMPTFSRALRDMLGRRNLRHGHVVHSVCYGEGGEGAFVRIETRRDITETAITP